MSGLNPGPEGGALTAVPGVTQAPHPRIQIVRFSDAIPGGIGAGIVDEDQLVGERLGLESDGYFAGQGQDVVRFIEHGNDDCDIGGHELILGIKRHFAKEQFLPESLACVVWLC